MDIAKPKIKIGAIRTGIQNTVRARYFYLDYFGQHIRLDNLQQGFRIVEQRCGLGSLSLVANNY